MPREVNLAKRGQHRAKKRNFQIHQNSSNLSNVGSEFLVEC